MNKPETTKDDGERHCCRPDSHEELLEALEEIQHRAVPLAAAFADRPGGLAARVIHEIAVAAIKKARGD